jgi:excisionase family DNA binding protein
MGTRRVAANGASTDARAASGELVAAEHTPEQGGGLRPLLVSTVQTLALLDIGRTSLYRLIDERELVPIKIGRSTRFVVSEIEQFVAARQAARGVVRLNR